MEEGMPTHLPSLRILITYNREMISKFAMEGVKNCTCLFQDNSDPLNNSKSQNAQDIFCVTNFCMLK
jgi:hypothetical protein